MGLLSFLFGRTPSASDRVPEFQLQARLDAIKVWTQANETPAPPTEPLRDPAVGDAFDLDYATSSSPLRRRKVMFLFGSPGNLVTGIDLEIRRLRTYKIDRARKIIRPSDGKEFDPAHFFRSYPVITAADLSERDEDRALALDMRKAMFCQVCLFLLLANADGPATADQMNVIMAYVKRENRFATREGWVQTGDKRRVWPILRDMIPKLPVRRDHLDIYVGTLRENWENSRRFAALNDALTELANLGSGPSPNMRAIGEAINKGGR